MDGYFELKSQGALQKADIVVVDDNKDNLRILSGILKIAGHAPRPVSSGEMALSAIGVKPPELVLLDIMMPGMDGFEVCRRLKSAEETRNIPVIFISALDDIDEKLRAFDAGGVDYVVKPFQEAEVLARVETHLKLVRAGEALRKSDAENRRLQKAKSLSRMAGAIAHQFNNYLHAVLGNLELGLEYLPDAEKTRRAMEAAMASAEKAADVSRMMLTYTGQAHGRHETVNLSDYCRVNFHLFRAGMPASVSLEPALPEPGPFVRANTDLLEQLFLHLLNNARESMADSAGTIRIGLETVQPGDIPEVNRFPVDWHPGNTPYACLVITDEGHGISPADMENIFDPFFSTQFTGRGMGLPAVLGIAGVHGGGISVTSTPGRGTAFRVYLPLADDAAAREAAFEPQTARPGRPETILVAEDEDIVRELISEYLQNRGYRVIEAEDGRQALEKFRMHQAEIGLVITDLTMPNMDGWETMAAMRELSPELYVILSSGHDEAKVMAGAGSEQPHAFLRKPYDMKALFREVEKGLRHGDAG